MIIKDLKAILHAHSTHSLLDAVSTPKDYIKYCCDKEVPFLALTEHGHLSNQYELFEHSKGTGIKTLCAIEAYVKLEEYDKETLGHLTMIAYSNQGRKNMYKLFNLSWDSPSIPRWGHKKPVLNFQQLREYSAGIFVGSGCLSSVCGKHFTKGRPDYAEQAIVKLIDIYGKDNVFCELMPCSAAWEWDRKTRTWQANKCTTWSGDESDYTKSYQTWLYGIAVNKYGLKPVLTTDSHFVYKEEHQLQTLVLQASEGGWHFHDSLEIKSKEEMYHKLDYLPNYDAKLYDSLISNGEDFASRVEYEGHLTDSTIKLPYSFNNENEEVSALLGAIKMERLNL